MHVLNDDVYEEITSLCEDGDNLVRAGDLSGALRRFHHAWTILPEPKEDWEACTWVLSAIGDTHFALGDYKNAVAALSNALQCPDGLGNPFIHLRLGESYLELGETSQAQDELARAYTGGGREIFETEDPKYYTFLQAVLKPSPGKKSI